MTYSDTAHIIIPNDVDRDDFVNDCLTRGVVYLYSQRLTYLKEVRISVNLFDYISFPSEAGKLGTEVIVQRLAGSSEYIIIGVLKDGNSPMSANEDMFSLGNGKCHTTVNVKDETISQVADEFRRKVNDDYVISSENMVRVAKQIAVDFIEGLSVGMTREDKSKLYMEISSEAININNENNGSISISNSDISIVGGKSVTIGNGDDVGVLGNVLADFLNSLITQISNITTTTTLGAMPILNKVAVETLKKDVSKILSKYLKIE